MTSLRRFGSFYTKSVNMYMRVYWMTLCLRFIHNTHFLHTGFGLRIELLPVSKTPFIGDSSVEERAVFTLTDSKGKVWEDTGIHKGFEVLFIDDVLDKN